MPASIVHGQRVSAEKLAFAKRLRRAMTPAERSLWTVLRRNRADGLHFRRQQIIEDFIVDFYCEAARLAVELDGASHDLSGRSDERRDAVLTSLGVRILRIPNEAMLQSREEVVGWVVEQARNRIGRKTNDLTPGPFPKGKGGRMAPGRRVASQVQDHAAAR